MTSRRRLGRATAERPGRRRSVWTRQDRLALQQWNAILGRVGHAPKQRLAWAVRVTQEPSRGRTDADWDNLSLELAVFAGLGPTGGGVTWREGKLDRPTSEEARAALAQLGPVLQTAVNRERVPIGRKIVDGYLTWDPRARRFRAWADDETDDWGTEARRVLARLLTDHGHLLKSCPAHVPRGDLDEPCGTWFVATRPRQAYCSPRCQSRAATRTWRRQHPGPAPESAPELKR